jgi:hypothetical protein
VDVRAAIRYPVGVASPEHDEEAIPLEVLPEQAPADDRTLSRLLVHLVFPRGFENYIEGAVPFVRIRGDDQLIVEQRLEYDPLSFWLLPGTYELGSYVRPCDANCGYLDGPTDECQATFTPMADRDLHVTIWVQAGHICTPIFE